MWNENQENCRRKNTFWPFWKKDKKAFKDVQTHAGLEGQIHLHSSLAASIYQSDPHWKTQPCDRVLCRPIKATFCPEIDISLFFFYYFAHCQCYILSAMMKVKPLWPPLQAFSECNHEKASCPRRKLNVQQIRVCKATLWSKLSLSTQGYNIMASTQICMPEQEQLLASRGMARLLYLCRIFL